MSRTARRTLVSCLCAIACLSGCRPGPDVRLAREAEQAGDVVRAYELYCEAAEDHRRSRRIASALRRLIPEAAAHYESQARQALARKDYAEAWRLSMRALEIQPNHPTAAERIRQLEANHPEAVAQVKADWRQRGSKWLELAANGKVRRPKAPKARPPVHPAGRASDVTPPKPIAGSRKGRPSAMKPTFGDDETPAATETPRTTTGTAAATKPSSSSPALKRTTLASKRPTTTTTRRSGYLVVRTLSRRDDRFPQRSILLDGLVAQLEETDGTPSADLTVLRDGRRVGEYARMQEGHLRRISGRSGFAYDLVLIAIEHPRRTVRLGLLPAER